MAEQAAFEDLTGFDAPSDLGKPNSEYEVDLGGMGYARVPRVTSDADFESLKPGQAFLDPQGNKRKKPYVVKDDREFDAVPEGEQFVGPDGQTRQKPKYEPVDFTANTLYHMAVNDKERRRALERSYPGKVRGEKAEDFYVEDDNGVLRKPKGFTEASGSFVAGIAAPTAGAAAGGILGGVATSPTGPGATAGAFGGATVGGMGGQVFNDMIMQLAGVYDRSGTEQAGNLGWAGLAGGGGEVVGRGVAAAIPTARHALTQYLPKTVAKLLGAEPEAVATATRLADQGVLVPPSAWAKEAPHVQNIAEVLDPAFRTQKPLQQSAEAHYEKTARHLLEDMGFDPPAAGELLKPTAAVSGKEAGEALIAKAVQESAEADARFAEALKPKLDAVSGKVVPLQENQQAVLQTAKEAREAADKLLNAGYQDIEKGIEDGMRIAKAGSNSGDLWWGVGEKLQAVRAGIQARHSQWYKQADEAAGGVLPDVGDLPARAAQLLERLPEGFAQQYPGIVKRIAELGETPPTFGQLHDLRTVLRNQIDWWKLDSDFKNGALKHLQNGVNDVLHDPGAAPELKIASKLLDATDRSYADQMAIFNSKQLNAVMKGLEAGVPADEQALYNTLFKEGNTELTRKVMGMIGPELTAGLRAADQRAMLDASRDLSGNIDGSRFAKEVVERYRGNMLNTIHGDEIGNKLLKQAQYLEQLEGKLPIPAKPGDTALDVISRARMAAEIAETEAKRDPLKMLGSEMKKITADHAKELKQAQAARNKEPLGFLYNETVGASQAVDRILRSEDLILATASKFGEKSPEFEMLRQVYVRRLMEGGMKPGDKLSGISPEIQQVMFPGASLSQMQRLAKDMDFLLDTKAARSGAGRSIMGVEAVEHPTTRLLGGGAKYVPKFLRAPADPVMRATLTQYYKFITELASNPAFLRWIDKGLNGDEQARQMTKAAVQRHIQKGGATGAAISEAEYQAPNQ